MVKSSSGVEGLRSFTIVDVTKHGGCRTKFTGGLYKSRNPVGAARKAFTRFEVSVLYLLPLEKLLRVVPRKFLDIN